MKKNINTLLIAVLLICIVIPIVTSFNVSTVQSQTTTYGDPLQYEWYSGSGGGNGPEMDNFGHGPAPDSFDVAWKWVSPGASLRACFSGYVFVSNSSGTFALDPNTGSIVYKVSTSSGLMIKLDNTYMLIGTTCVRIADGTVMWSNSTWSQVFGVGMSYAYDDKNKLMWVAGSTMWNFSDGTKPPKLVWNQSALEDGWITYRDYAVIGDGRVYLKLPGIEVKCLDEFTGKLLWRTPTKGTIMYQALYHQGKFIAGSLSGDVIALDGATGTELWKFNPGGYWNFWASWPCAAYGIFYEQNFDGYIYAINATTGKLIWKYKGPGNFYPAGPTVADYKVYVQLGTANYRDPATGARGYDQNVCLDALTGKVLWSRDIEGGQAFSAFGNIYFALSQQNQAATSFHGHSGLNPGEVWCITGKPHNWAMYGSDPSNTFEGAGPRVLTLKWQAFTGGAVTASPTIVDGKVYVGSYDYNIYAYDAYTGAKKWSFTTGYQVKSAVAVVNNRVYTGVDDGNAYCLNAATGEQIWKVTLTNKTTYMSLNMGPQTRSSPKVVNNKVYFGSIDKNLYCLDATTGARVFTFPSGGMILSSPAVVDGSVYFNSMTPGANGTIYKIDANTGNTIWTLKLPYLRTQTSRFNGESGGDIGAAPVIAKGAIYQAWDGGSPDPNGGGLYKINATTGAIIWNATTHWTSDTVIGYAPMLYYEGVPHFESSLPANTTEVPGGPLVSYENRNLNLNNVTLVKQDVVLCNDLFYQVIALNATDGKQLWNTFVGRETFGFAISEPGQFYAVCEAKAIYDFDSRDGSKISFAEPPAQSWSNPALYDSMLFVGSQDWALRCYGESSAGVEYPAPAPVPTPKPSASPTAQPTSAPTAQPTSEPTVQPTSAPTASPTPTITTPPSGGMGTEIYIGIAAVVIIAVVVVAALLLRRRK
jgi:outer membrane protein assembly factor BamB